MSHSAKVYDLEKKSYCYARAVRMFFRKLPRTDSVIDNWRQLLKASGSIGANYIEANDSLSRKDFRMRIKICWKEAKETGYWLRLLDAEGVALDQERKVLLDESVQLMKIFGAILRNTRDNEKQSA